MFPLILFCVFLLKVAQVNGDVTGSQEKNAKMESGSVDLKGQLSWELLLDVDNSDNDGAITRQVTYTTSLHVNRRNLVTAVIKAISAEADVVVEVISVDLKSGSNGSGLDAVKKLEEAKDSNPEIQEETKLTTTVNVKERSSLKLYQLVFNGPGMSQRLDKLSSTPHLLDDVIISCSYRTKSNSLI